MRRLEIKRVPNVRATGSVYTLEEVTFGIHPDVPVTAVVDGEEVELPTELMAWAIQVQDAAKDDPNFWPAEVEFCLLPNGRYSADFVLPD